MENSHVQINEKGISRRTSNLLYSAHISSYRVVRSPCANADRFVEIRYKPCAYAYKTYDAAHARIMYE